MPGISGVDCAPTASGQTAQLAAHTSSEKHRRRFRLITASLVEVVASNPTNPPLAATGFTQRELTLACLIAPELRSAVVSHCALINSGVAGKKRPLFVIASNSNTLNIDWESPF